MLDFRSQVCYTMLMLITTVAMLAIVYVTLDN